MKNFSAYIRLAQQVVVFLISVTTLIRNVLDLLGPAINYHGNQAREV